MKTFSICLFVIFGVFIANTAFAQTITGIDPDRGLPGQTIAIRVIGTGFVSPVVASFSGSGITITGTNFVNSTEVRVTIKIDPTAAVGARTLTIAGGSAIFTVSKVIGEQPGQRIPQNVVGANDFIDLIDNIVDWIFVVVLVFAVIFIVLAGLQFISATSFCGVP
ncbi:MAG: hypothetical protein UY25_C0001G0170 [Candidatus Yanofskybacteria bacterium GW2011_GWC1_48_11]|uniref:IPT/TIG domain-containing protein n=1 Tax=Candidatus Yanofskybacteria bacterium GW2011_GWC1_48_11 TaxID=1619027 RepID=A0A837IR89_9BACT|nr:MAG: hypothetical protein UY25_C0001G0170 [Candidatus Yanofskybacteria bacterium GW2011_GWC1_48_11]